CLDATQHAALTHEMLGDAVEPALLSSLPDRIALGAHLAKELFRHGALRAVFDELPGRVLLNAKVKVRVQSDRDELALMLRSAEPSERVYKRLAESWILKEPSEPSVQDLPPLRDPTQPLARALVVEPLQEVLAQRRAMLNNSMWRLSAEIYGNIAFGTL